MKKLKDKDILANVIEATRYSKNKFSTMLNYKSAMSIYNVLEGRNEMTEDMIARIVLKFPEVNYMYLTKGEGEPLRKGAALVNQKNLLNIEDEESKSKNPFQDFAEVPETLSRIEKLLERIADNLDKN